MLKKVIFIMLIPLLISIYSGISYGQLDAHVVGYWQFDEGKGMDVEDSSKNGHDGKIVGGAQWTKEGKVGAALDFQRTGRVEIPNNDGSLDLQTFTIEAWVKLTALPENFNAAFQVISMQDGPFAGWMMEFLIGNPMMLALPGLNWKRAQAKTDPEVGEWHHYMGIYDGHQVRIYVDGKLEGKTAATGEIGYGGVPLVIGSAPGGGEAIVGIVDEVRLSDVARQQPVEPAGKLAVLWGRAKIGYTPR